MSKRKTSPMHTRGDELRDYVLLAMFATIILLLMFTPVGFINLVIIKATIVQVPVIIGSVLLGPKKGAVLGGVFGLGSFISNTSIPVPLSFCFSPLIPVPTLNRGSLWALVICFLPRLLVGIVPWYAYKLMRLPLRRETRRTRTVELAVTGVIGAVTNTVFVMGLIYFVFREPFAAIKNIRPEAVLGAVMAIVGTSGVAEAAVSAVLTTAVCYPLQHMLGQEGLKGEPVVSSQPSASQRPDFTPSEEPFGQEPSTPDDDNGNGEAS